VAPTGTMTTQIKNLSTMEPMNVTYGNFTLNDEYTVGFDMDIGSSNTPLFVDPGTGLSIGLLVSMEYKKKSATSSSKQSFNTIFAATGTVATFTIAAPQSAYLTFSIAGSGFPSANYKTLPIAGEYVTLTLYHVNSKGALISVASELVLISHEE
jgi:hypothetical protein